MARETKSAQKPRTAPDYRRLPETIDLEDTIATHESDPPPDPTRGRDTDRDFMLRYAAL